MPRSTLVLAGVALLLLDSPQANAQEKARFTWQRGQALNYKVLQTTRVLDQTTEAKNELVSEVDQTKQWTVQDVDADGIASVQLSLSKLSVKQKLPGGETLQFSSEKPEEGSKQLREQLAPLIGKPLVVLRVDAAGKVVEVKSSLLGPASRYESELPFAVTLPGGPLGSGQTWSRNYRIVLDPPLGAGEKYNGEQTYDVKSLTDGRAVIALRTTIKDFPKTAADQLPLLQLQPTGTATFDTHRGVMVQIRYTSGGTVEGHSGDGSKYEFSSEYQETLIEK